MSRPYYAEYIRHCLRFYCRNLDATTFRHEIDKINWLACKRVLDNLPDKSREIIIMIHSERDTLADNVYNASEQYDINQSVIWDLLKEVEYAIAKARGLV